ncbi:hypothetical protein D9619_007601 [Psilocybe cf. subviscida]|uniref:Uncharacterized protein n=1 Tax=Psilocybe cf. subviscida TaxID=2480587 RepID=A0A8H5EX74_9AGAR|nr:hypothetical protein D9619_007601 [Psilocybe cf. subviscida]
MSQPPTKCPRNAANPFLDLEAADRDGELKEAEDATDHAFIDDEYEDEKDGFAESTCQICHELVDALRK